MLQELRTRPKEGVIEQNMFIDGKYVDASGKTFESVNPATGEVIAKVAEGRLRRRRPGGQGRAQGVRRGSVAEDGGRRTLGDPDEDRGRDQEAACRSSPSSSRSITGKPIRESSHLDIPRSAYNFEFFAELVKYEGTDAIRSTTSSSTTRCANRSGRGRLHQPLELAAPAADVETRRRRWRAGTRSCASRRSSRRITASFSARSRTKPALPPGVLNIVQGFGPNAAGSAITEHPDVDCISFTGETTTGKAIMKAAARGTQGSLDGAGRQGRGGDLRRRRPRRRVAQTIRRRSSTKAKSAWPRRGCSCSARSSMSSASAIRRPRKRSCSAIRSTESTSIGSLVDPEHSRRVNRLHRDRARRRERGCSSAAKARSCRRRSTRARSSKPTAFVDVDNQDAHLPGRSVRPGRHDRAVRHRRRRRRDRQRREVRPRRDGLHPRPAARASRRAQASAPASCG